MNFTNYRLLINGKLVYPVSGTVSSNYKDPVLDYFNRKYGIQLNIIWEEVRANPGI